MRRTNTNPYHADWPEISRKARERANHQCLGCGRVADPRTAIISKGNKLGVHHKDFNPQNNDDDNHLVLCQVCHLLLQSGNVPAGLLAITGPFYVRRGSKLKRETLDKPVLT